MKKLLAILLLTISFSTQADCLDTAQNGTGSILISWAPDTQREDGSQFPPADNSGYKVYYTDTTDGIDCARLIPDRNILNSTFTIHKDRDYNFNVTQLDTGNRESVFSTTIPVRVGSPPVIIVRPSAISNLAITRVTKQGLDYSFNFSPVTTFEDGTLLPSGAISKYFLFVNNVWVGNIKSQNIPYITQLNVGDNIIEIETEIFVNDSFIVSNRSPAQLINVKAYVSPPKPPTQIKIDIPAGSTSIFMTFGN